VGKHACTLQPAVVVTKLNDLLCRSENDVRFHLQVFSSRPMRLLAHKRLLHPRLAFCRNFYLFTSLCIGSVGFRLNCASVWLRFWGHASLRRLLQRVFLKILIADAMSSCVCKIVQTHFCIIKNIDVYE